MRVERVEAMGFGPLSQAVLELPEGMTLIFGPNEAGKSSWHGALYAGICGLRRARGRAPAVDQAFELKHRPWDGGPWKVRAVVALAGGMRVELTQDLAAREGTAIDLATGRDVTSGILRDQVPDASQWLGLDRDAFRAVACVQQTALLQIRQQPRQLAGHLQRAAATAGTNATAAEAIRRIEGFLADQVGTDRAWTKPLVLARNDVTEAQEMQRRAEKEHAELAGLRERLREASEDKEARERQLHLAEAAEARQRADDALDIWNQAADLSAKYPESPRPLAADDSLAQRARAAVGGYRNRPAVPELERPSAAELDAEMAALPQMPAGDVTPTAEIEAASDTVRHAQAALHSVNGLRPAFAAAPERAPAETSELRRLADALAEPLPQTPPDQNLRGPDQGDGRAAARNPLLGAIAVLATVLLLGGAAAAVVARQPVGWVAVAAGAVIGAALLAAVLRAHARQIAALRDLQVAGPAQATRVAAEQRRASAHARVAALALPGEPTALLELADADDQARVAASQWKAWQKNLGEAQTNLQQALGQLSRELAARGVTVTQDPEADFRSYVADCTRRHDQAAEAARRPGLNSQLRDRRQAEDQAAEASARRSAAEQELRHAASACRLPEAETAALDALADIIEGWLDERNTTIGQHQQAVEQYAVLQRLLDGSTLDELKAEADHLTHDAMSAADGLDQAEITYVDLGSDPAQTMRGLRGAAQDARDKVTELQTTVRDRERGVPSVAEAEEAVAQASIRAARLERLSRVLTTTRTFLIQAQDSVHRTIAPQLAQAIRPHLGAVTAGRYTDVMVDPDDLQVRVRASSGAWREADNLSHGTAEQVYLLLRAALAQYLVTTEEPCPLILDDPTAYADDPRTMAVLQVLHHVSAEQQVILFSHDSHVLTWARDALNGPRDKIIELDRIPPA
jgi:DNA repair protein SbcC/Rad50